MTKPDALVFVALFAAGISGCAKLGYTNRVLLHVPAPNGSVVAVCQEIPELDGPGYAVRLETPAGATVRRLYEIGDGDPCSEFAWSSDGHTLAVLSAHVARVRFVDIEWAMTHAQIATSHGSWRTVDLSTEKEVRMGRDIRFVGPGEIELSVCSYSLSENRRTHERRCTSPETRKRFVVPLPIKTARVGFP